MTKTMATRRNKKREESSVHTGSDKKTSQSRRDDVKYNDGTEGEEPHQSSWQVIVRHPLFWGFLILGLPYLCYLFFRYVVLQKPQWIPTVLVPWLESSTALSIPVRPAVSMSSPRQVLIVGSMSSGTSQVAHDMSTVFPGLELGHEDSDTMWKFVRDGTVSWFHGIRFFPKPPSSHSQEDIDNAVTKTDLPWSMNQTAGNLCGVAFTFYTSKSNYGFGPTLFGTPNYTCSFMNPNFKKCWMKECVRTISMEYGCAWDQSCPTPFKRTLIQTRDPWNTVTSLVTKYCRSKDDFLQTPVKPPISLVKFFVALFGQKFLTSDEEEKYGKSVPYVSCESLMVHYVVTYYNMLLDAYKQQANSEGNNAAKDDKAATLIDGVFPIESSTPCDVAKFAGLDDPSTTVHEPNYETVRRVCGDDHHHQQQEGLPGVFQRTQNLINRDRLDRTDVMEAIMKHKDVRNNSLYELLDGKMQHLYARLMYYEYPLLQLSREKTLNRNDEF